MEAQCLSAREIPHSSKIYSLYLEDFGRVAEYYAHPPSLDGILASASEVNLQAATRAAGVAALREQNRAFGSDASVERNLDRLAAGAVAIVAGQQVGLFTGPAYSIYKALTAVRVAREITARSVDAVPIYWLAGEDHDLAEINQCWWSTRQGLERLALEGRAGTVGRRVGEIPLEEAGAALAASAADMLDGSAAQQIGGALRAACGPDDTYSSSFGKLMARLLPGRGLILIDALDARIQALAAPVYHRALAENAALIRELLARSKALENAGFHAQVKVLERGTLLFVILDGMRVALRAKNGEFAAGAEGFSASELIARGESPPAFFSANVLLRPVVQDTLLPTAACVAGPGEVAYFAQASVVYRRLLGRMPVILPRAGFTLVEPHVKRLLRKYRLEIRDVLQGRQRLRAVLERESLPRRLARQFSTGERNLRRYLARLRRPLGKLDPTLLGALTTAERKVLYQFEKLRGKAGRAEDLRAKLLDGHEQILRDALFPHHGLQERTQCLLPFLARHGPGLLDQLEERALGPVAASGTCAEHGGSCHHVLFL